MQHAFELPTPSHKTQTSDRYHHIFNQIPMKSGHSIEGFQHVLVTKTTKIKQSNQLYSLSFFNYEYKKQLNT